MDARAGAVILAAIVTGAAAQGGPAFDVVSIKSNNSDSRQRNFNDAPGGHFAAVNVALGDLIRVSHGVRPAGAVYSQLVNGGVPWLDSDRFDIKATTNGQPPRPELLAMIRAMLTERFRLRVRSVSREETVLELRLLRDDGRLGPGLRPTALACDGPGPQCTLTNLPGRIAATGIALEGLTHMLSGWIDGRLEVRDRTGLAGRYSVDLTWTPSQGRVVLPDGVAAPAVDPDGPPLATALQDQLGLRLVRTTVDVPVLVVEGAERPSPD